MVRRSVGSVPRCSKPSFTKAAIRRIRESGAAFVNRSERARRRIFAVSPAQVRRSGTASGGPREPQQGHSFAAPAWVHVECTDGPREERAAGQNLGHGEPLSVDAIDWRRAPHNLLLEGPRAATEATLRRLAPRLRRPVDRTPAVCVRHPRALCCRVVLQAQCTSALR